MDTGWISSEGPFVKEFEQKMSDSVGRKYGIVVTNGTDALEVTVFCDDWERWNDRYK